MSKLFEHVPTDVSAAHNVQRDSCRSPLYLSRGKIRGKPVTGDPIFYARSFVRPALQSTALYLLVIVIAMMAMVKPAQASGTVTSTLNTYYVSGSGFGYYRTAASPDAVCSGYVVTQLSPTRWQCTYTYTSNDGVPPSYWGTQYIIYAQYISPVCPANSSGATTCTCIDPYVPDAAGSSCILLTCDTGYKPDPTGTSCVPVVTCPAHASGTPCACEAGYKFDAAGTSCVSTCPIDPLPKPPPPFSDACSNSLEKGSGTDVDNACAAGLTPDMVKEASCLADKIHALAIPSTGPSGTVRTTAYQNHLRDVWDKSEEIKKKLLSMSDAEKQACAARIVDVTNEMAHHGIDSPPSKKEGDAPHVLGRAIDIPRAVANALIAQVTTTTTVPILPDCFSCTITLTDDVEDYINSTTVNPPACNLRWGGRFSPVDPVHFQLP